MRLRSLLIALFLTAGTFAGVGMSTGVAPALAAAPSVAPAPAVKNNPCPPPPAPRRTYPPAACKVTITPNPQRQGGPVHVSACGFIPGSTVTVRISGRLWGTPTAHPRDCIQFYTLVPFRTSVGTHTVTAAGTGQDNNPRLLSGQLTVTPRFVGTAGVSDNTPGQGQTITVSGGHFAPNTPVSIDIHSTTAHLATVNSNSSGKVSTQVKIPSSLSTGGHTISLTGAAPGGGTTVLSVPVTVQGSSSFSSLPHTGAVIYPMVTGAAVLIGAGSLLIVAGRRRRGATTA
jgi:hypothetical protein